MDSQLIEAAPVGLGAFDRDLRWVRVNEALAALNATTVERMLGRTPGELHGAVGAVYEARLRAVLAGEEPAEMVVTGVLPGDPAGRRAWELRHFPLGEGLGVVVTDVTDRLLAESSLAEAHRRDALMARAGHLLGTALSVTETAELVARLVVPELADWAFVELVREDGRIDRVAMAHRDQEKERWVRAIDREFPLDPASPVGSPAVIRSGRPELLPEIPDALLEQAASSPEHLRALREAGFTSACIVPLVARGRVLGDIALATDAVSGRRLTEGVVPIASALADRCALALDNAVAFEQRETVALTLQGELLPRALPPIPGLDIAVRYNAAGAGNEVGGDFYDVFASGDGWIVVIGDVVGKGPLAASVTGLARHTLRAAATYETTPSALLDGLNRALYAEEPGRRLASVALLRLTPAEGGVDVTLAVGGHPLPLVVSGDGEVREIGVHGRLLGVEPDAVVRDAGTRLRPGDTVVLYTDGVVEARGPGGMLGEAALRAIVADSVGDAPSRVVQRIEQAVLAASGGRPRDDIAVVALRLWPVA